MYEWVVRRASQDHQIIQVNNSIPTVTVNISIRTHAKTYWKTLFTINFHVTIQEDHRLGLHNFFYQIVAALETHIHHSRTSQTLQIIRSTRNQSALSLSQVIKHSSKSRTTETRVLPCAERLVDWRWPGDTRGAARCCRAVAPPSRAVAVPEHCTQQIRRWLARTVVTRNLHLYEIFLVFTRDFV